MSNTEEKLKVLFLCTGNSCRSQMAEGWARALKSDTIAAWSAGIETHGLNPNAVQVMAEAGVDISTHRSKRVDEVEDVAFDCVVTVCGHANETCPMWLKGKAQVVHVGFADPPALARELAAHGVGEQAQLDCYRRVRDEIRAFVESLPDTLERRLLRAPFRQALGRDAEAIPGNQPLVPDRGFQKSMLPPAAGGRDGRRGCDGDAAMVFEAADHFEILHDG